MYAFYNFKHKHMDCNRQIWVSPCIKIWYYIHQWRTYWILLHLYLLKLFLFLCSSCCCQDSDYIEERTTMFEVMADINFILSHNSPVLIIQKYVRGMLARRTLDLLHRLEIWKYFQIIFFGMFFKSY